MLTHPNLHLFDIASNGTKFHNYVIIFTREINAGLSEHYAYIIY